VEFIVSAMFLLVPMAILMLMMGKYIEAKQRTEQAARYAAWERTVWYQSAPGSAPIKAQKNDADVVREAQLRIYAVREQGIYSDLAKAEAAFEIDPLLNFAYRGEGKYEPVLVDRDEEAEEETARYLAGGTVERKTPGIGGYLDSVFDTIHALPHLSGFDLNTRGTYTATVSTGLHVPARIAEFADLELELSRSVTLVAEGWNAGGPKHTWSRVRSLVPIAMIDSKIANTITGVVSSVEPFKPLKQIRFGWVDVEPVPVQYLE
jgi:hypothetical protein